MAEGMLSVCCSICSATCTIVHKFNLGACSTSAFLLSIHWVVLRQLDGLVGKQALFAGGKSGKGPAGKQALFLLYLDAISVVNQQAAGRQAASVEQHEQPNDHLPATQATAFTLRDLQFIVKFAQVNLASNALLSDSGEGPLPGSLSWSQRTALRSVQWTPLVCNAACSL